MAKKILYWTGGTIGGFILLVILIASSPSETENKKDVTSRALPDNSSTTTETKTIPENNIEKTYNTNIAPSSDTTYYSVIKVVDGDTISVDLNGTNETIRLIGINTPETVDLRKPVECFGTEASVKAKELLSGKNVQLVYDPSQGSRDKYGRLLAYIYRDDGLFFNQHMIEQGYAYEYTYNTPYKYQAEFKYAQADAQQNQRGLWKPGTCNTNTLQTNEKPTQETPITSNPSNHSCSSDIYNCSDFSTQAEAQEAFNACGGVTHDIHKLDSDKDGEPCESLP